MGLVGFLDEGSEIGLFEETWGFDLVAVLVMEVDEIFPPVEEEEGDLDWGGHFGGTNEMGAGSPGSDLSGIDDSWILEFLGMFTDKPELVQVELAEEDELVEGGFGSFRGSFWNEIWVCGEGNDEVYGLELSFEPGIRAGTSQDLIDILEGSWDSFHPESVMDEAGQGIATGFGEHSGHTGIIGNFKDRWEGIKDRCGVFLPRRGEKSGNQR